ncbi:hypothetical protein E0F15_14605 [Frankia sp. B2]|jgi:hypothetical protein|nr:hypothetical protein KBI5_10965 [Frankia sp. KB5]ORT94576.1 hypothetical protein UK99_15840 [Frankia casuarinae]TFE28763.1 hypothetical protein E0F15_14605 [Frankia sp. B2]
MVVQPGLEPTREAVTSTVPQCWISSDRSRTVFTQAKIMIRKRVDLTRQQKNRSVLVEGPEITVRPVGTRQLTRNDAR